MEKEAANCLSASLTLLSEEGVKEVRHYLDHGEPEMALEGLLIELIGQDGTPDPFDYDEWIAIARQAGLDTDPVFDPEILLKFSAWAARRKEPR